MSESDEFDTGMEWPALPHPVIPADPEAGVDVPPEVLAEEAFLDAVVSHVDDDTSDIQQARDKVSQWYNSTDETDSTPKVRRGHPQAG